MEALNFSALYFKSQMTRPSFSNHAILDTRERRCCPRSCIDSHLCVFPQKRCKLVSGGHFGVGENSLTCLPEPNSQAVPFKKAFRSRSVRPRRVTREESGGTLSGESILLNELTLERELKIAIEEENYAQAAKIRDSLRHLQEDSKASVLAANARFYNSFRKGDLAAMQALWSKGEHVCVVHPGVSGVSSYDHASYVDL